MTPGDSRALHFTESAIPLLTFPPKCNDYFMMHFLSTAVLNKITCGDSPGCISKKVQRQCLHSPQNAKVSWMHFSEMQCS